MRCASCSARLDFDRKYADWKDSSGADAITRYLPARRCPPAACRH
jgi:hypothetical protein